MSGLLDVPAKDGNFISLPYYHPLKLANYFNEESDDFKRLMSDTIKHGSDAQMVFHLNEIVPGDPLKPDILNKFYVFYASFLEFGLEALCREEVWLCVLILRRPVYKSLAGGVSGGFRTLMRECHFSATNFSTAIVIDVFSGPILLRARYALLIADEATYRSAMLFDSCALCSF